jgi:hypothetical protein
MLDQKQGMPYITHADDDSNLPMMINSELSAIAKLTPTP